MDESVCVDHVQCPACAARGADRHKDNLGVFSNGSAYCFSCGTYYPRFTNGDISTRLTKDTDILQIQHEGVNLPDDVDYTYPHCARDWLNSYDIPELAIKLNKVMWSERLQRLIFPIYGKNELLAWQGRYFGPDPSKPKWYSVGISNDIYHFLGKPSDKLILVEDIVSAIKLSLNYQVMPLFGCTIGTKRGVRLRTLGFKHLDIWLDPDKRKESMKEALRLSALGLSTKVIFSDKDPKEIPIDRYYSILQR